MGLAPSTSWLNKAAPGNGAIAPPCNGVRLLRAVPEQRRLAMKSSIAIRRLALTADAGRSPLALASWVDKSPDNHQFSCMKQPIMTKSILSPKNFLEANMKSILTMALVLAFCGLAGAQGGKGDPIGTW